MRRSRQRRRTGGRGPRGPLLVVVGLVASCLGAWLPLLAAASPTLIQVRLVAPAQALGACPLNAPFGVFAVKTLDPAGAPTAMKAEVVGGPLLDPAAGECFYQTQDGFTGFEAGDTVRILATDGTALRACDEEPTLLGLDDGIDILLVVLHLDEDEPCDVGD